MSSSSQAHELSGIDPLIGTTLDGRYRLLRAIGEGGMGVVYEAEHVLIEKRVAIKVLRESFTRRPDVVERFRQEARSASRIGHPNIVDVSDFGETPSRSSYIVMEMLTGEDLADVLSREYALAPARAASIVFQVAVALSAAHKKGIIHRDLKPENIYLISRDGQPDFVKVVDFGVAKMSDIETLGGRKLTRTGMIFGTPEYMSPEHAGGKALDHRVDIYALGVILYELLTGRVPFEGDNFMEVLSKHGRDAVPELRAMNPGTRVSAELSRVVFRALEKEPERRYQSMEEMLVDLRAAPELPRTSGIDAHALPEWARSAPPPPPPASSTLSVEARTRAISGRRGRFGSPWIWLTASALAVVGLALALVWSRGVEPDVSVAPSIARLEPPLAAAVRAPTASPATLEPVAMATPKVSDAADHVNVRLRTEPAGARAMLDGVGVVCSTTPCTFAAPRGREVVLRVQAGERSVVRRLAFEDAADLQLNLSATARAKTAASPSKVAKRTPSDLKVPALFR